MGKDAALHNDNEALRVAIIAENFLPNIDGSTITLAHLLQHLAPTRVRAMLLGPECGMHEYAEARLFGTFWVPLRVYPALKIMWVFFYLLSAILFHLPRLSPRPALLRPARHLPRRPHLTRRAGTHRAASTDRSPSLRLVWSATPVNVIILSVGRPSPEKNLGLVAWGVVRGCPLPTLTENSINETRSTTKLVFVGDAPYLSTLQQLCAQLGVDAVFMGQLTGRKLGERWGVRMS
ncbi:hypothetical protein B0H13DRAFT_2535677 [Mycena leptocephala]|nr:hypothetical protein B0H13DRAFT_2535677 [Mycena leptocephala]